MYFIYSWRKEVMPNPKFFDRTRFVVLFLGLLTIICTYTNYTCINFTVICMKDVIVDQKVGNETHWLENPSQTSLVFSSAAFGAILGLLPSVPLTSRFGIRNILSTYGLLSSVATILIPTAVHFGFAPVLMARVLQGFGASILYSSIGPISEGWSPISEISTYVAFLSAGFQVSNIFSQPVSGILCDSTYGWRSIFYIYGGIGFMVTLCFYSFFRDSASMHKNVSQKELHKISNGREPITTTSRRNVPYWAMTKDKVVLAIWASSIGGNVAVSTLMTYGPTYLSKVLGMEIKETGFNNMIPYILAATVKFIAGPLSDHLTVIPDTWRMVFFAAISEGGMAIGLFVMAWTRVRLIAQIAYTTSIVLAGINIVGIVKCAQLVTRQYTQFVMAVISLTAWIGIFLLPIIIGWACPTNSVEEWSNFLFGLGCWIIVMNIAFPFVVTTKPAEYTKPDWKNGNKVKMAEEAC